MSSTEPLTKDILLNYLPIKWKQFIGYKEFEQPYWDNIVNKLNKGNFYPELENIFNVFKLIKPNDVKVIIVGQDPYINKNQAIGMAFAVNNGILIPPTLRNIFIEINNEYSLKKDIKKYIKKGNLTPLVKEGVLLLNNILTVKPGKSLSHKNIGWEKFTSKVIQKLDTYNVNNIIVSSIKDNIAVNNNVANSNIIYDAGNKVANDNKHNVLFVGFGNYARDILIKHVKFNSMLIYGHPSPLNTTNPFIGCNCFKQINEVLKNNNISEINWSIIFNNDII